MIVREMEHLEVEKFVDYSTLFLSSAKSMRTSPMYESPQMVAYRSSCKHSFHTQLNTKSLVSGLIVPAVFSADTKYTPLEIQIKIPVYKTVMLHVSFSKELDPYDFPLVVLHIISIISFTNSACSSVVFELE